MLCRYSCATVFGRAAYGNAIVAVKSIPFIRSGADGECVVIGEIDEYLKIDRRIIGPRKSVAVTAVFKILQKVIAVPILIARKLKEDVVVLVSAFIHRVARPLCNCAVRAG